MRPTLTALAVILFSLAQPAAPAHAQTSCALTVADMEAIAGELVSSMTADPAFLRISEGGSPRTQIAPLNNDNVRSTTVDSSELHVAIRNALVRSGRIRLFVQGVPTPTDYAIQTTASDDRSHAVTIGLILARGDGLEIGRWQTSRRAAC